jgi:GGDEF domain-containing protein
LLSYRWGQDDFITIFIDDNVRQIIFVLERIFIRFKLIFIEVDVHSIFIIFIHRWDEFLNIPAAAVIHDNA